MGGHCLPIDPSYLSWRVERALGKSFRFVELANDINSHMPDYVVHRLMMGLNSRGRPVKGAADTSARPGLQEEHRRCARVSRRPRRPAAGRDGSRGAGGRPARGRGHAPSMTS